MKRSRTKQLSYFKLIKLIHDMNKRGSVPWKPEGFLVFVHVQIKVEINRGTNAR